MHAFKDNFETPFLLQFICMGFCITAFELFHNVDIGNGAFGLNFNFLIIYNFDFIFNGDFYS
jgi:hypothetical protein